MRTKGLRNKVLKISEGILETVVDVVLLEMAYVGEAATTFSRNTWEPAVKADRFLEEINYQTIKRAIEEARKKGWLKRTDRRRVWPEITVEGKKRLNSLVPQYDEKRIWDHRLYLVTYDIPETRKNDRELLREYLKRIGAGMIQESVWLTPYNPREVLREFIEERKLRGAIIISDVGKDGSIGEEDIKDLVIRVYRLNEINKKYQEFLEKFADSQAKLWEVALSYWAILKNDPQLPFELLPSDWLGEKAHQLFLKFQAKLNT
ncbi:CRISPR-associated endonuclease Cas2 [Candidatus Gottesmanbacteria bacterium]|nr:CRISPR-associated endonuclease Cas2 [Candidatus Gottesmanbacteria bacterium]MBI5465506.1 CRISPR-associated endonuclease Cas2 [Candidatus Gottesmanbacteria bacterium]